MRSPNFVGPFMFFSCKALSTIVVVFVFCFVSPRPRAFFTVATCGLITNVCCLNQFRLFVSKPNVCSCPSPDRPRCLQCFLAGENPFVIASIHVFHRFCFIMVVASISAQRCHHSFLARICKKSLYKAIISHHHHFVA